MAALVVNLLRVVSLVICLIVIASFGVFAVQQTKSASHKQQEQLESEGSNGQPRGAHTHPGSAAREGSVHKNLDEASNWFTSPFAGIVSASNSEWGSHIVKLLLALVVYGFGIGYLVRILSVRV
jgi:hypothetical protein